MSILGTVIKKAVPLVAPKVVSAANNFKTTVQNAAQKVPSTPVTQPTTPAFDQATYAKQQQDGVNSIYDAQQASQLAALKAQQDKALGLLNQQKTELAPQYQSARNQSDVTSAQNVQRLRELMASQGLSASGENVTAQTSANNQRLNSLNSLNLQEQQANNDINRQISDVNDPYQAQAIINQIAAQRSQALFDAQNRADETGYQRGRDVIGDQRYTSETAYNHGRDAIGDQRYTSETAYNHGRDKVGDTQWQKTFDQNAKTTAQDQAWRKYTYTHMSATDKAQLAQNAKQYGEDTAWRMYELKYNGEITKSTNQATINAYTNP